MKLFSLAITPENSWQVPSEKNPLRLSVKLLSDASTVEMRLSEGLAQRILDLIAAEIHTEAQRNLQDFISAARGIEERAEAIKSLASDEIPF